MIELAPKAIHKPDFTDTTPRGVLISTETLVADLNTQVARLHALGIIVKLELVEQPRLVGRKESPPKLQFEAFNRVYGRDL